MKKLDKDIATQIVATIPSVVRGNYSSDNLIAAAQFLKQYPTAYEDDVDIPYELRCIDHYRGPAGSFDYDTRKWYREDDDLLWVGGEQRCDLPKGIKSCHRMFQNKTLGRDFYFGDFNTAEVRDMSHMFEGCVFPENFQLSDKFSTQNVINMSAMFANTQLPVGFSLGRNFDTSKVIDMSEMFLDCVMSPGFSLGDKFSTGRVATMENMFKFCTFADEMSLGLLFDTRLCKNLKRMFYGCSFCQGFSLGDKFDVSLLPRMNEMFKESKVHGVDAAAMDREHPMQQVIMQFKNYIS